MAESKRNIPTCHPDRQHWAKGLCKSCYQHRWNTAKLNRVQGRERKPYAQKATCHPGRKHMAYGMCNPCYQRFKHQRDPEKSRKASNEWRRQWKAKNADRWKRYVRNANLKSKFGVTIEQYDAMLSAQGGVCALCGRHERALSKRLAVDHCHATNVVRGLLCGPCNVVLGYIENAEWFSGARKYLDKWRGRLA